jgi:hypothetical protein
VKDQGIGLLHGVSGFLQHTLDYNMPAGLCRLRLAGARPRHPIFLFNLLPGGVSHWI